MLFDALRAARHRKAARRAMTADPKAAAAHLAKAIALRPGDEPRVERAVDGLVALGELELARAATADASRRGDPLGYWSRYDAYLAELQRIAAEDAAPDRAGALKIALFNDTDGRLNVGCRLTSQGFKGALRAAFPHAAIRSTPFRFAAFRAELSAEPPPDAAAFEARLRARLAHGYGPDAADRLGAADLVVLHPEGSLDDGVTLDGVKTFLAPVVLARWLQKPFAVANGTIPVYADARGAAIAAILKPAAAAAARDAISAEGYGIAYLPDAALLHRPAVVGRPRDGCLITTGARADEAEDRAIAERALEVCDALGLRPVVLTRASDRFRAFRPAVLARGGALAETASLEAAAETIGACRLHIGARYHMAIFALLCGVPSLLFDVKTHKNQWLAGYSPLIDLVAPGASLVARAEAALAADHPPVAVQDELTGAYAAFLQAAAAPPPPTGAAERLAALGPFA